MLIEVISVSRYQHLTKRLIIITGLATTTGRRPSISHRNLDRGNLRFSKMGFLLFSIICAVLFHPSWAGVLKEQNTNGMVLRFRRNAAITDSNNIRVTLGATQTHPASAILQIEGNKNDEDEEVFLYARTNPSVRHYEDQTKTSHQKQISADVHAITTGFDISPVKIVVDEGNDGGEHLNNVVIGGIQNFSDRSTTEILKMVQVDANNMGGIHHSTVTIGGMLIF